METQLDDLKQTIESIESDLAYDRSKLDDILTAVKSLTARVENIEKRMPRTENKMQDALERVLKPIIETPKKKRKSFLKKLMGGELHG